MTVCYYHVTDTFQSESTLHSCLNFKELLARNRREIWSLSNCHDTRTHNHLVRKRTLNCCENLSVRCIWLYVIFMSRTRFRVNPHSIVAWTVPLQSLKLQISRLFRSRSYLTLSEITKKIFKLEKNENKQPKKEKGN